MDKALVIFVGVVMDFEHNGDESGELSGVVTDNFSVIRLKN